MIDDIDFVSIIMIDDKMHDDWWRWIRSSCDDWYLIQFWMIIKMMIANENDYVDDIPMMNDECLVVMYDDWSWVLTMTDDWFW